MSEKKQKTAKPMPRWKRVECPYCLSGVGESCGRRPFAVPWGWERVSPHQARMVLAANTALPEESITQEARNAD